MSSAKGGKRAIIVGGSMSGLFAAAFLGRAGWGIDVFERSPVELVGRGAGIVAHPELLEALELSGAGTRNLGVEVEKRITLDREGRVIGERALKQIMTSWDRLQRLLRAAIRDDQYHLGCTFQSAEQDGNRVLVRFAEGRTECADLLVGADGIRSGVRAQVAPDIQPVYAGYYIWRGAASEAKLAPETRRSVFPYFTFFLPPHEEVLCYPIAGFNDDLRPGQRRYNFIWYRVGDAQRLKEMCIDANGDQHAYSVPPPLVRKSLISEMRADAARELPPVLIDCLNNIEQPFFTPIYDFTSPRLVFGRIAFVGDAAATARPHMGFGVSKAGDDARALAECLAYHGGSIDAGLAGYNAMRQPIGNQIVLHGRKLGTHMGVNLRTDEDRGMSALLQDYRAMMDWIANPGFLETPSCGPDGPS
jgi:2-polyprenyl-6-methoxyphenol hydroxylase-like FAD-dependent oxidoreductase